MDKQNFNFETAMKRIEEIVRVLENGQVSLDESMKLYEEGVSLVTKANALLSEAKQKLIMISGEAETND